MQGRKKKVGPTEQLYDHHRGSLKFLLGHVAHCRLDTIRVLSLSLSLHIDELQLGPYVVVVDIPRQGPIGQKQTARVLGDALDGHPIDVGIFSRNDFDTIAHTDSCLVCGGAVVQFEVVCIQHQLRRKAMRRTAFLAQERVCCAPVRLFRSTGRPQTLRHISKTFPFLGKGLCFLFPLLFLFLFKTPPLAKSTTPTYPPLLYSTGCLFWWSLFSMHTFDHGHKYVGSCANANLETREIT